MTDVDYIATKVYHLPMSEKLSEQVRQAILDADISRYRLATEGRVDPGHLSRFVNRKAGLGFDAIDRIGVVLGLRLATSKRKEK